MMASDFAKVSTEKIYHYEVSEEPAGMKLEAHGQLARTWPAFEETALVEVEHWLDFAGTFYAE